MLPASDRKKADVSLVIMVALKAELPFEELTSWGHRPFTLKQLKSEGVSLLKNSKILLLITGVGPHAAHESAQWIHTHLNAKMVLNLGTTGCQNRSVELFSWVYPKILGEREGAEEWITISPFFPIPMPQNLLTEVTLISSPSPVHHKTHQDQDQITCYDMEAFYAASYFQNDPKTPFFVLKIVSDFTDQDESTDFSARLSIIRKKMLECLEFLKPPDHADISVIIPIYNRPTLLCRAVDSVLAQTLPPLEIILVNDGSTDSSFAVIEQYCKTNGIRALHLPENRGVSAARNHAVQESLGTWLAFLDADDAWEKNKLLSQWEHLKQEPFYEITQCEEIWIRDGVRVNRCKHHAKLSGFIFNESLHRCLVSPSAVLLKKTLLNRYGGFDENLRACEDYDLWLKILRHHPVGLNTEPSLFKYGGHEDQLSRKYVAMDRFRVESLFRILEHETDPRFQVEIRNVLLKKAQILATGYQKRGDHKNNAHYTTMINKVMETQPCKS